MNDYTDAQHKAATKAKLIGRIISSLRAAAREQGKAFNEGDTFFSLCFKSGTQLLKIAKLCGHKV